MSKNQKDKNKLDKLDRINREWKLCKKSAHLASIGASAGPVDKSNITYWEAIISGPIDTPYEGGVFTLTIDFENVDYPNHPPIIKVKKVNGFIPIFHPNINLNSGLICLSILKDDDWTKETTIEECLSSFVNLLSDYDNLDAAQAGWLQEPRELFLKDIKYKSLFIQKAKEYTKKYGDI
jgi:ubiquitin-protein ligase